MPWISLPGNTGFMDGFASIETYKSGIPLDAGPLNRLQSAEMRSEKEHSPINISIRNPIFILPPFLVININNREISQRKNFCKGYFIGFPA